MGAIGCSETSVTTNILRVTSQKSEKLKGAIDPEIKINE
jgi:hypothetical protein